MRTLSLVGALALALLAPLSAHAAATAGATSTPPRIVTERALLVWDPARPSEHLFVTAELEAAEGPVAMVLPTPLVPAVEPLTDDPSPALNRLFATHAAKAEIEVAEALPKGEAATPRTMPAADAGALGAWLDRNGLAAHPELADFARSYGEKAFHYVALRLADAKPDEPRVLPWTAISFVAPGPYYPLVTPAASFDERTRLEIYTLSPELLALTLGEHFETGSAALITRDELSAAVGEAWMSATGIEKEGPSLWLQRFEPQRTAIGQEDAFFVRVPTPAKKTISEGASTSVSRNGKRLGLLLLFGVLGAALAWLESWDRRSKRGANG